MRQTRDNDGSRISEIFIFYSLAQKESLRHKNVQRMMPDWVSIARFLTWISFTLFQYIVLLILVFLLELSTGTIAYIYERNVPEELNMTLSETFTRNYAVSERHTKAIDLMQQNLGCCGAVRFEEYAQSVWLRSKRKDLIRPIEGRIVPDSCCLTMTDGCGTSYHPSNIPYTVCISNYFRSFP